MYPYIYIGGIQISTYSMCTFIGLIVSFVILIIFLKEQRLVHVYVPIVAVGFIGLFAGAKLCGITSKCLYDFIVNGNLDLYDSIANSGIVYLGGLVGFLITIKLACRIRNVSKYPIYNLLSVTIPLFHAFGRIGCFFAGCCYGCENSSWLSLPYRVTEQDEWVNRFPTQLVEAGVELALFTVFLLVYLRRQKHQVRSCSNELIPAYLFTYSVFRFFIEYYRGDEVRGVVFGVSFSQIFCIAILIYLITVYTYQKRKKVI